MKKCLVRAAVLSTLLVAGFSNAYAVDVSANVILTGNVAEGINHKATSSEKAYSDYKFLQLNKKNQVDPDGVQFDVRGDAAGAHIAMHYTTAENKEDWAAVFRRTYVWIKPIDMLKLQFGYNGNDSFYKEKIEWWKVGSPFKYDERDWTAHPSYVNCADVDEWGFGAELTPMDGLILNAAIAPAGSNAGLSFDTKNAKKSFAYTAWGAGAKYYWSNLGFQLSYRDNGKDDWKVVRAGVGYEGDGFGGFFQPVLGLDYNSNKDKLEATGLCLDMYGEYSYDSFKLMAHVPVTLRFKSFNGTKDEKKADPSYIEFNVVGKYNFGSFGNVNDLTPYFMVKTISVDSGLYDPDTQSTQYSVWLLNNNFKNSFNLALVPGVELKIGKCEMNIGAEFDLYSKYDQVDNSKAEWGWKVPFKFKMAL